LPAITQVSTDLANPPAINAAGRSADVFASPVRPIDETGARAQAQYYPEIAGRRYALSTDQLGDIIAGLLRARNWQPIARTGAGTPQEPERFTGIARTLVFAIPADISIRIIDDGDSTIVDMRSAIRFGPHDLGLDRSFVTGFLDDLDTAVALQ
jgi:hypothetical protein